MCIVLYIYVKLIWCNGFPQIYASLEEGWGQSAMGIYALCYIWNWFGIMVFQRSMPDWRRGWGQYAIGICAFCYIWNLFGVLVFQRSMLDWRSGWGQSAIGICALCYIYMKLMWCNGFAQIYVQLGESIYQICGVMVFQRSMLNWRSGGSKSTSRSARLGVAVFKAFLLNWNGGPLADLPSLVYQCSRHLCSIDGGPLADLPSLA